MKKILFILPSLDIGGLERVQVTIANALASCGYDVTVMTFDDGESLVPQLLPEVHFIHRQPKYNWIKKIPKIRYYFDDGLWETRATPEQLHKYYVGNEKYDVEIAFFRGRSIKIISGGAKNTRKVWNRKLVCSKKNDAGLAKIDARREAKTKYIAWVHSDFRKAGGVLANFHDIDEVKEAYLQFDNIVCVSEEAKQGFIETIGDIGNLVTIYNMLPVESIRQKAQEQPTVCVKKEQLHLVLVGRLLDSAKGQKRLINVVSRLHNEGIKISLSLIGGGPDEEMLMEQIHLLHAEEFITMCGSQLNPYPFIKEADLLVCVSYFEGYNLTVAEALILGIPVLSTDCTGPNEILDYGKFGMVVENSQSGLYTGILKIAEHPEILKELRRKTNERQNFFDESRILKQITDLFN